MTKKTKLTRSDIKFYPPERLTDNADGGGMPLGTPLTGEANELFSPIPAIARVNGAFYAHLVYLGVMRSDDEVLSGAYAAITKPPKDPSTSYLLFRATKYGELREEILKRIEAFNVGTIESAMTMLSTQTKHSKIVQAYQRQNDPLPVVGDVYCLRQDKDGYPQAEQYVQVTSVDSLDRTFTTPSGKDFVRTVIKLEISQPLTADFIGVDYPVEDYADNPCKIRETHIADAAKYYGVKPITAAITKQTMQLRIAGLFEKIIPTSQIETALIDLTAAGQRQNLFNASKDGKKGLADAGSFHFSDYSEMYFGRSVVPGSITLSIRNGGNVEQGTIKDKGGTLYFNGDPVGSINYARGVASFANTFRYYHAYRSLFRPAASLLKVADTTKIDITTNNRSYNYVLTIDPPPTAGSLMISYRSQGNWYDLYDDGTGALRGASVAHGSASVSYATGTVSLTCGELPDVDSSILFAWGNSGQYYNRSGGQIHAQMVMNVTSDIAAPSTLTLEWNNIYHYKAHCDAAGNITGGWTGKYDVAKKQIRINTNEGFKHPEGVLSVTASYGKGKRTEQKHDAPLRDSEGKITLDLGNKPIKPNTLKLRYNLLIENYDPDKVHEGESFTRNWIDPYKTLRDDGNGNLVDLDGINVGTVDYTASTLKFNPDCKVKLPKAVYKKIPCGEKVIAQTLIGGGETVTPLYRNLFSHYEYYDAGASMPIDESGFVEVSFYNTDPTSTVTETLQSGTFELNLLPNNAESIIPGTLNFTFCWKQHYDKQGGIYIDFNAETGTAKKVGSVNYTTGTVTFDKGYGGSNFPSNMAAYYTADITAMATTINGNPVDNVTFRTPTSPIRPASLQIRATATDGTKLTAKAELSGEIKGDNMSGFVDTEYGVADVRFGKLVDATGKENEPWFNPDAVENGKIWQPKHVFAETVLFNAVAYSYLPVDSTVVKIDTVRLPRDGKVPIFRRGDSILISNTKTDDIGSAHTAGETVQLSRNDVDRICVTDADGTPVNAELWDYDLDNGTITWKSPLDLSAYKMPLKVKHAQEEKNRILKCDIDGTLSLIFPTKRDYPIEGTYISSLLIGGDLQVRHSVPFTQRNWNDEWADEPKGKQLLNKLNLKDYPMVLTDDGAIKERWVIIMKGGNQFELYGETLGFVKKGDTTEDLKPINPATNKPYFTIKREAFGNDAPWSVQDVIRFNTWGTLLPIWVLCAQQPTSSAQTEEDGFTMCLFGDTTEL